MYGHYLNVPYKIKMSCHHQVPIVKVSFLNVHTKVFPYYIWPSALVFLLLFFSLCYSPCYCVKILQKTIIIVSRQIIIPSWYHELFWTFETVLHQWIFHLIFIISSSLCIYYEQLWEIKSVSVDCDSSREQRTVNIFKMGHGRVSSPITLLFSKCHVHFV